jgi:hypothetical protein
MKFLELADRRKKGRRGREKGKRRGRRGEDRGKKKGEERKK